MYSESKRRRADSHPDPILPKKKARHDAVPEQRLPDGLVQLDAAALSPEQVLALYERDQMVWLRLPEDSRNKCSAFSFATVRECVHMPRFSMLIMCWFQLCTQYAQHPELFGARFSVENPG